MCPVSDDRPVSLAAAIGEITRANECGDINDGPFVELENALRALPTFSPATPDAPKSVEEMADAIGTILPCPFCGSSADHRGEAAYVRCTNLSCETMGPSDDPTGSKWNAVPRGLPAPEWTGPDRWQHWIAESAYHPGDYAPLAPEGYKPVGPWECPCPPFVAANGTYNRDWRRPLRRVQG